LRRIAFKNQVENLIVDKNTVAIRGEKWKNTTQALGALDNAMRLAGNGWWPNVDRYTDIVDQIKVNDVILGRLGALRETIEEVSDRSYDTALTEYHLGCLFGFDARPFIILGVLGERLCEEFGDVVCHASKCLETALSEADDEEPEWWVPINAAAVRATKETSAWLKDVQLFHYRLSKAAARGYTFF
jgi:hypothetical protein